MVWFLRREGYIQRRQSDKSLRKPDLYLPKDEAYYTHSAGASLADRLLQVPAPPAEAFFLRFAGAIGGDSYRRLRPTRRPAASGDASYTSRVLHPVLWVSCFRAPSLPTGPTAEPAFQRGCAMAAGCGTTMGSESPRPRIRHGFGVV